MRRDGSSACASNGWSTSAPIAPARVRSSTPSRRRPRRRSASTTSLRFTAGTGWCSPTRRRRPPTAAPAVRTSPTCGSVWSKRRARSSASIRSSSAAAIFSSKAFPLKTPTGSTYDSADPARLLDTALRRRTGRLSRSGGKAAKKDGKLRGIGLALFLEPSGGMGKEQVEIRDRADGGLSMYSLAGPSGQGTRPCFRRWSPNPGSARGSHRAARTTTTRRRRCSAPAASARAR